MKKLMESKELWVELRPGKPSYMVLRGTYGEKIHQAFRMTRQGVRWRFQRLFNDIYVSAFETILFIEKTFGTAAAGARDPDQQGAVRPAAAGRRKRLPKCRFADSSTTRAGQSRLIGRGIQM